MSTQRIGRNGRGSAYILAIVLLALFAGLAAAFASVTGNSVRLGKNLADIQAARFSAESGLRFAVRHLRAVALPHDTDDGNVIVNLAGGLGQRLDTTSNLGGAAVTHTASAVIVPRIRTADGTFQIQVLQWSDRRLSLQVEGTASGVKRVLAMDLALVPGHPNSVFNYGIASRGTIGIGGSAQIRGQNQLNDASVISATTGATAVSVSGSAVIDGDISSVGASSTVVITGSPTIAGSQDPEVIAEHVHFGVDPPAFPTVDTSIFRPLATTVIDPTTDINGPGRVFNNVLIKAGTNPTFSNDVVLNGIVFIEVPNCVTFTSKVTLNGLVAAEQKPGSLNTCRLSFEGQVEAFGVDALPPGPPFEAVKAMTGTFIVAPGFDVSFAGQFTTINGTVAADKLTFTGQASGTIKGSVIGLANYPTSIYGTVDIMIDRSGDTGDDAGFLQPMSLRLLPRTYREMNGT